MGITAELRAKLLNIRKFAVDSAITEVYGIAKEKSKGEAPPAKSDVAAAVVEEMQARLEKLREKTTVELQSEFQSLATVGDEEHPNKHLHFFDEPRTNRTPDGSGKRRTFIRSRL